MKKILTLIAVCAITIATNAQIVSSSSRSITTEASIFSNYTRLFISYTPMSFSGDIGKLLDTAPGISLGWTGGWSISRTIPMYVEGGVSMKYNWGKIAEEKDYYYDDKSEINYLGLIVPISISYKYSIPGTEDLSFAPFAGLHLTGNLLAKEKVTEGKEGTSATYNWFDKDDMDDDTAKRVQFGWQVGLGMNYKALYLGVGYSAEFTEILDDVKTGGLTLSLGYNF